MGLVFLVSGVVREGALSVRVGRQLIELFSHLCELMGSPSLGKRRRTKEGDVRVYRV